MTTLDPASSPRRQGGMMAPPRPHSLLPPGLLALTILTGCGLVQHPPSGGRPQWQELYVRGTHEVTLQEWRAAEIDLVQAIRLGPSTRSPDFAPEFYLALAYRGQAKDQQALVTLRAARRALGPADGTAAQRRLLEEIDEVERKLLPEPTAAPDFSAAKSAADPPTPASVPNPPLPPQRPVPPLASGAPEASSRPPQPARPHTRAPYRPDSSPATSTSSVTPTEDWLRGLQQTAAGMLSAAATFQAPPLAQVDTPFHAVLTVSALKELDALTREARTRAPGDTVQGSQALLGLENEVIFTANCEKCFTSTSPAVQAYVGRDLCWEWIVTPPDDRDLVLTASLWVRMTNPSNKQLAPARTSLKTLEATIHVRVGALARLEHFLESNWQWLWTTPVPAVGGWALMLWRRSRKRPRRQRPSSTSTTAGYSTSARA